MANDERQHSANRPVWDEASLERVHQVPDKARRVQAMFDAIVPRYELVNTLTTLGLDGTWRRRLVRAMELPQGARVLDIACGTGQVVRAFQKYRQEVAGICGVDFSAEMVREANRLEEERYGGGSAGSGSRCQTGVRSTPYAPGTLAPGTQVERQHGQPAPSIQLIAPADRGIRALGAPANRAGVAPGWFAQGDAQYLPFEDKSFDAVTCVFGVRNFAEPQAGLAEMFRVLRPGGMVGILEFSMPRVAVLAGLYKVYFRAVLPRLASCLSGDRGGAYHYLQKSVESFCRQVDLRERLRQCGFAQVQVRPLTFGVVCLYMAVRPMGEQV